MSEPFRCMVLGETITEAEKWIRLHPMFGEGGARPVRSVEDLMGWMNGVVCICVGGYRDNPIAPAVWPFKQFGVVFVEEVW